MENRDVVVVTCGTSLLGHLKSRDMDPAGAAEWLGSQDPQARECGAEVNALASLLQEHESVRPRVLSLHCSDTPEGRQVGELLQRALPRLFPACDEVSCHYVADLDGTRAEVFRSRGLRHLAASLAGDVRTYGAERIVLNATGGFKAMVALAQALAQAAGIPAYYRFEAARGGLLIPPCPLASTSPSGFGSRRCFGRCGSRG
jgi:putative CRISPR-associated protein (TIGR02619 family)